MIPIKWWFVERDPKNLNRFVETSMVFASKGEHQESLVLEPNGVILGNYGKVPVMLKTLEYQTPLAGCHTDEVIGDLEFLVKRVRNRWIEHVSSKDSDEGIIYGVVQSYGLKRNPELVFSIQLGLAFSTHPLEPYFVSPELTADQCDELRLPVAFI